MPSAAHVVLVSIDGLKPEYYLDPRWPTPALRQVLHAGAHAEAVLPIFPSLTYPSHVTLSTGALPARHGVQTNRVIQPVRDPRWLTDASLIRVPALWDAVRAAGGTTAALNWPLTVGAPIDWNLPDVWPGNDEQLVDAMAAAANPPDLRAELERQATGRLHPGNFSSKLLGHDVRLATMAAYLFERHRPTLLMVHTESMVQIQQTPDWRDPRRERSVAVSDLVVSVLLEAIDRAGAWGDTALVVCGDHGMTDVHTQLRPNVWLADAGLRPHRFPDSIEEGEEGVGWSATFHALGGSALLRVREPVDGNAVAVRGVIEALPAAVRSTFRIVERAELDRLGSDPDSPFALAAAPGFVLDQRADPPAMQPNPGMSHGHHPEVTDMHTGLVAMGAGIRAGTAAPVLRLPDLAPLVAELLGLDFEAPDGVAWPGLLA